ncbi:MAG: class I adenylate-forming enzyme family protein [Actinomycetota bacterium]
MSRTKIGGGRITLNTSEPGWAPRLRAFGRDGKKINFANFIDVLADLYKNRTAFVLDRTIDYPGFSGDTLSYRDVQRLVNRMAHGLRALGVQKGDRVAMITANRVEMAFCNFAAGKIGAVPVPMNFMLRPSEIDYIIQKSGAEVLICDPLVYENTIRDTSNVPSVKKWAMLGDDGNCPPAMTSIRSLMETAPDDVEPVLPRSDEETALLFFTSGTTGFPKGAMLSHSSAMVGVRFHGKLNALRPKLGEGLSMLVMPVAHSGGYTAMLLQLANGTPSYFVSRFNPAHILGLIEELRATFFVGSPAMYRMLLDAGAEQRDLSSIRVWGGGADSFDDPLVRKFRDLAARRTKVGIRLKPMFVRGYGMAEANSHVSTTLWFPLGENCLGWVMPPVRFRIVTEEGNDVRRGAVGELLLKGPSLMHGYWNDPEATDAAMDHGWFHTGDLVRQGKWRMLYFAGRSGDIIKSGGYKIAAAEIDHVIAAHPDVDIAATVGMPDKVRGELPVTAVTMRPGATATPEEILAFARDRLALYKCPREIRVVGSMPLTISLKVKRREVLEQLLSETQ